MEKKTKRSGKLIVKECFKSGNSEKKGRDKNQVQRTALEKLVQAIGI